MLLKFLQFLAHTNQSGKYVGILVNTGAVLVKHLACGGNLESSHLHEVVYHANLLNVLLRILAHILSYGLRFQMRKLRLPIAQCRLAHVEHLCHFLDGIVEFHVLVGVQCHIIY